jgi:hypothetical protein
MFQVWNPAMQKIIDFPDMTSGRRAAASDQQAASVPGAPPPPPSIEPILAVVDSLSRTLDCIKAMCATEPTGPIRDRLETERANLVIGLFVARVAAMRVCSGEPVREESVNLSLQVASRR